MEKEKKILFSFKSYSSRFYFFLIVGNAALRELEHHVATRQPPVDLGVGVQTVVDTTTLLLVQDDLDDLAAVLLGANTLAHNLHRVDNVGQDGVVDRGQGARARALLGELGAGARRALGTRQDAARGDDNNMAVGELLLKLTSEAVESVSLCLAARLMMS